MEELWGQPDQHIRAGEVTEGCDDKVQETMMEQSGFVNVHLNVETISSRQLGMRAFLEITLGFKRLLLQGDELESALTTLAEADALIDTPDAWALVGVFLATGEVSSDAPDL